MSADEPEVWPNEFEDVSSERRRAEARRLADRAAQRGVSAQARFLATMSHELRTPLNVVIGFSDAIMRDTAGTITADQLAEYAGSINEAGRQLLSLVEVILDVARVEGGEFELPSDLIEIPHLINGCVALAMPSATASDLLLRSETWPGLPLLRGDERRLRQGLNHLITNAIKFTPAGGSVRVSARREDDQGDLLIMVSDTGIGIAAGDIDRVFEPFLQLESSFARRFPGSGLGLYVTQITARAHAGELLLRSHVGAGTTAVLRLPAWRLVEPPPPPPAQDAP